MALDKAAPVAVAEPPKADAPAAPVVAATPSAAAAPAPKRTMTADEAKVRGQVRMHAIVAGYQVGGQLAATLGTSPASIREELHVLAKEVADRIERYSFND